MSETKTNDEVIAENPIERSGEVKTETKADYKVDLKTGSTTKNKPSTVTKVDLTKKPKEDAVQIGETKEVVVEKQTGDSVKMDEQIHESSEATEEFKQIQEIDEKEVKQVEATVKEAIRDEKVLGKQLPENIEKLVNFMEDTGGTVEDYVRLNADYSNVDGSALLKEYYKKAKPHLNDEEIGFIMEDNFEYDEEVDDERDVRKKKLAFKEEVAKAHSYLEDLKGKYYDEIKLRPGVTQEQKKAMDFFNRYNEDQQIASQQHEDFKTKTKEYLSDDFKGFDFKVGDKNFRYNVKNPNEVAESQSNISTFVQKFLDNDGAVKDHEGYHKAIYAARNADTIAQHFYEQGKADAVKDVVSKSKNINNESRPQPTGDVFVGGFKVKAVSGSDSRGLKIKTRKFNN
tara:strand:- start:15426 stop:16625 length:1200 start_codon:yes stop_codon:yes gene_type:complete